MNVWGTALAWLCAGIVALPLAPCAFLSATCFPGEVREQVALAHQGQRSCCPHHAEPIEQPARAPGERPCEPECCRIAPFVPPLEKMAPADELIALVVVVPLPVYGDAVRGCTIEGNAVASSVPLHVLHCQWRC